MFSSGLSIIIAIAGVIFTVGTIISIILLIKDLITKKRYFHTNGFKDIASILFAIALIAGIFYLLYNAPLILFYGETWEMVDEFGPSSLINAAASIIAVLPLFYIYYLLECFFPKKQKNRPYFMIITLSIASGLGNTMVVFIINQALGRVMGSESRWAAIDSGLGIFLAIGIILFTVCSYIVRKRLIKITSEVVYDKRVEIIDKIGKAPFDKFEALEDGKVYATLNNDTETVSGVVTALINGLSGIITLVACCIYLGTLNLPGTILTVVMMCVAIVAFLLVSRRAERKFELNRDIQNYFYKFIDDLVMGFKELYINKIKRKEFLVDMKQSCADYRDSRIDGEFTYIGVSILGEILYIVVIGLIVFLFPVLYPSLSIGVLANYVMIFLYMGGIVNSEIYLVPQLVRVLVSWRRITSFIKEISFEYETPEKANVPENSGDLDIKLENVKFAYKNENGEHFEVGPINCELKSGEIIFISGGNGSGKSTLAKLISGYYTPDEGSLTINGVKADNETLGSYFSIIFSDYHLFDKMYGIKYDDKTEEIKRYLDLLCISDKVQVKDGVFNTIKLSTGQKKRLALLITYLEDRPAYLFDEWAADQDPEFRKYFYMELLPQLKEKGKLIIAVTHDDRYFGQADKQIKMEVGKVVSYKTNKAEALVK